MRLIHAAVLCITCVFVLGCFTQVAEEREPLPEIVWPKPPGVPRIRFVNSISRKEHLNIEDEASKRLLGFFKGIKESFIIKPHGITTDVDGRLFVVDTFNRFIHVFDAKNDVYYTFPEEDPLFVSPIGIATDKSGMVFVTDSKEAVVRVFTDNGKTYVREIGKDILERPTGIAVNEKTGELLVVDTLNSQIMRYSLATYKLKGIYGKSGTVEGRLHSPTNIFVSRDGFIFVTDALNFRIQIFSPEMEFIRSFGKAGDTPGSFSRPKGIAVDSDGHIYVVDALFDSIQIFDREGNPIMDFGGPGYKYGEFWLPSGISIDSNDMIYVSDSYNNRVQVFEYLKGDKLF